MSNRRKPRKNAPRASRHLHSVSPQDDSAPENQPLIQMLRPALRTGDPIDFLMMISGIISVTRPSPFPRQNEAERPSLDTLVDSFIDVSLRETTAALRVVHALLDDDSLRGRIDAELVSRRQPVPPWITALGEVTVTGVVNSAEELGDGENIAIGFRIPGEQPITMVAFLDHNLGSAVKDAFPFPGDHGDLAAEIDRQAGSDVRVLELDTATARARLEGALGRTDMTLGIPESDTWPQARAWLEWLMRLLPEGGADTVANVWSDGALTDLAKRFARSPEGKSLPYKDTEDMAETLVWLHGDEPTRWSPIVVEIILADRLPRKVFDTAANLARFPDVMRAFIRFCHRELDISGESTIETLRSVDHYERGFLDRINCGGAPSSDPSALVGEYLRRAIADGHDPAEILPSIIGRTVDELDYDADFGAPRSAAYEEALRRLNEMTYDSLARAVGGHARLLALNSVPLPDEPFDWDGIPSEIRGPVDEVLALCDAAADTLLDVEHRTAMRRFLADTARRSPALFARRASADRLAAAVAWVITGANHSAGGHKRAILTVGELLSHFDVKGGISQRGHQVLSAYGIDEPDYAQGVLSLGRADLLTAARRRGIAHFRDRTAPGASH